MSKRERIVKTRIRPPKYVECPLCGKQNLLEIGGGIIGMFDTRLVNLAYKRALKGEYHTWTCKVCGRKFIRSNVICDCIFESDVLKHELGGIIVKSKRPMPKFVCAKCGGGPSLEWLNYETKATRSNCITLEMERIIRKKKR